jgi:hypothetical protein
MRKALVALPALVVLLLIVVSGATADSDKAALVIKLDPPICHLGASGLDAYGSVHNVFTSNGKWKLTCQADTYTGPTITKALVVRSRPDAPLDECWTPLGITYDWQVVFTPSGRSTLMCKGDLSP